MPENKKNFKLFTAMILLGIIVIILYWRYLTGKYLFIFPDVVNDGITQFLPENLYLARNYEKTGINNSYTLSNGFGGWLSINHPLKLPIILFGEEAVPYLIGVMQSLGIFLAGFFMAAFLVELNWDISTCIIGGVAYSLSYQLIISSCWNNQAEIAIVAALFFLSTEKIFHKKYLWIIGWVACLMILLKWFWIYWQLLYGGLGMLYIAVRLAIVLVNSRKVSPKKLLSIYGVVVGVAVLLLTFILKDTLFYIFKSDRFLIGFSTWKDEWRNTFSWINFQNIITSYYRTLAPNIMGISWLDNYHGMPMQSCLDDGGFYITILGLYCIVILLDKKNQCKNRSLGGLALLIIAIFVCLPGIRLSVNGFVNVTYKLSRLWIILLFLFLMLWAWQDKISTKSDINLKPIMVTSIIISISLFIPLNIVDEYLYTNEVLMVLIFIWAYTISFYIWNKYQKKRNKLRYIFMILCCIEGICLNNSFVNNRNALTPQELANGYYNDGTEAAIKIIKSKDKDSIYRINKSYQSVMLCDPIAQDFFSTMFYHGGVDDANVTSFIETFGLPTLCNKAGYLSGTYGYSALSSILGVKYNITDNSQCIESNARHIGETAGKQMYVNPNALPLVIGYQTIMPYDKFMEYSLCQRHDIITQGCYVDNETFFKINNGNRYETEVIKTRNIKPTKVYSYENYSIATPLEFDTLSADEIAVVRIKDSEDKCVYLYWKTEEEGWNDKNLHVMSIYPSNGESFIEIANQKGLQGIIFYGFDDKEIQTLNEVIIEIYNRSDYCQLIETELDKLKSSSIHYEYASEEMISGELVMEQNGLIFISIPYSAPYSYYINGEKAETICVDNIFTGIIADKGQYKIYIKKDNI